MHKITPFLRFNGNADEAVNFYMTVFKDGKIHSKTLYPEGTPGKAGDLMTVEFELLGQRFGAINAWPEFTFSEAISFAINCENQEEVDYYWNSLTADGGEESQCGWLKDKFGLSWQVVPVEMERLLSKGDVEKINKMMKVMMGMKKLDMAALEAAYNS